MESKQLDEQMVVALWTRTKAGMNDELVNTHDARRYWISTIRYPRAGWQTAVFDRKRLIWEMRPIFRINEMESPAPAFINHCAAIMVVVEARRDAWPRGMKWKTPVEPSWQDAWAKVHSELPPDLSFRLGEFLLPKWEIVDFYADIRLRYHCTHR